MVIEDYIRSTPELDHHVVIAARDDCPWESFAGARDVIDLSGGRRVSPRLVRRIISELQPDIVHAHSTFSGVHGRLALPRWARARLVYTPHCFAFERRDIGALRRRVYWWLEALLAAWSPAAVVAVSEREGAAARRLPRSRDVTHAPNVVRLPEVEPAVGTRPAGRRSVVTVGRITAAKDPAFFERVVAACGADDVDWTWIGAGESDDEARLRALGVEVTGWLPRAEVLARIAAADLYVHTASWEGTPISVLEAASLGVPIYGRRIDALEAMGVAPLFDEAEALAEAIAALPDARTEVAIRAGETVRRLHDPDAQAAALRHAYAPLLSA